MPSVQRQAEPRSPERSLEQRARHSEALFEGIDDEVFVHDLDGRILDANPAACRRLGYTRDELLRMTTRDIDDPEFASGFEGRLQEQLTQGRLSCEGCHVTKDGRRIPVDINTSFIEIDGKPAVLAVMRDITRRKTAERRLAAQYAVTRVLAESTSLVATAPRILQAIGEGLNWDIGTLWRVESSDQTLRPAGYWQAASLKVVEMEPATRALTLERDQDLAGRAWVARQPLWFPHLEQEIRTARVLVALVSGLRNAFAFAIRVDDNVVGVVEFFSRHMEPPDADLLTLLTALGSQIGQFMERRRAEDQQQRMQSLLVQSDKLASIGLLSAGVAHEINNPLAYVSNNLAVLERDVKGLRDLLDVYEETRPIVESLSPDLAERATQLAEEIDLPYIRDNLDRILKRTRDGVERITRIVQGLRSLARTDKPQMELASLTDLVESSLELIRGRLQRRDIELALHFDAVPRVRCVATQVGQVVLNLLVNALQAIEANVGQFAGKIDVTLQQAGRDVVVEVADNGCGIEPKDLPRIFDPFYSSKPVGEGTGLGLSITHNIVTGHGGRIEVESRPGEGSRFRVFLPLDSHRGPE